MIQTRYANHLHTIQITNLDSESQNQPSVTFIDAQNEEDKSDNSSVKVQYAPTKVFPMMRRETYMSEWIPYSQKNMMFGFSCLRKFQKCWMSIFNRRIKIIFGYPVQVGDLCFIFAFLALLIQQIANFEIESDCHSQGIIVSIVMMLTTIFGCRNGLINFIFGLSLERAVQWHKFLGWSTVILSVDLWVHAEYSLDGVLMEACIISLVAFSLPPIRRLAWEFFIKMHWILIICLFVISIVHGVPYGYAGCAMFFIDVFIR